MFLEVHLLQNFALSNLNRDDTGAPKSCIFGGSRRARISSQCQKRAIRTFVREEGLVPSEDLARRTKKIVKEIVQRLSTMGLNEDQAREITRKAMAALQLNLKQDKTEYLLMLGEREIRQLAELCFSVAGKKVDEKIWSKQLLDVLDGGDAVDLALFGRMVATHIDKNIDAAVQMAHAFSTHAIANEFDYYTAVDDLQEEADAEGAGAAMLGTILYNSSCYYRYANLDMSQLTKNLHGQRDKAVFAADAFFEGMVKAVPTGKQNNSAAQNPPSLIMVVVRERGLWSLANAFTTPIWGSQKDLLTASSEQLLKHWSQLISIYGNVGIRYVGLSTYLPVQGMVADGISVESTLSDLKRKVLVDLEVGQN